jgi:hypothetical protein
VLPGTSKATEPGSVEDYLAIPTGDNISYGMGAYLLLAVEVARLRGEVSAYR